MPVYTVRYREWVPKERETVIEAWCWEEAARVFKKNNRGTNILSIKKINPTTSGVKE